MNDLKVFKQFASVGIGSIINVIIGLITTPIITRLVNPDEYGQLSIFNTYANIAMMLISLGFDQVLLRYYYLNDEQSYKQKVISKCLIIPIMLFCILALPISIIYYKKGNISSKADFLIFTLFLLEVMCLLVNRISILVVKLNGKANLYSLLNVIQKIVYVSIAIPLILIINSKAFLILVFSTFISYLIPTIISIIIERKLFKFNFKNKDEKLNYKEMLKYGLPMLLSSSVYLVFQAIDKISLQYFCDYNEVGIYASAASLLSIIAIIRTSFTSVWIPIAVQYYEKNKDDKEFYIKINQIVTVVMFAFGITLMFSKDLIVLLLGEKYRQAAIILPFLLFQPIMYTISETTVIGLIFKKKANMQLTASLISCICNIILNIILISLLGSKGASISTGVSYIIFFIMRTILSKKYFPINYKLGKFTILTILTILFSVYTSFYNFNILTLVFYAGLILIIVVLYKDILNYYLKKLIEWKRGKK